MKKDFKNVFVTFSMIGVMLLSGVLLYNKKNIVTPNSPVSASKSIPTYTTKKYAQTKSTTTAKTPTNTAPAVQATVTAPIVVPTSRQSRAS